MGVYRLPAHVEARMLTILDDSAARFGEAARDRYAALIVQAMQDVANDPGRPGARSEPEIDRAALFYHLRHSRERVRDPPGRVRTPRHVLVYERAADGGVEILGLIPDMIPAEIAVPRLVTRGSEGE